MIVALYTRVSTEQQVDKDSLSTQRGQLEAYCRAQSIKKFKLYEEQGRSAKDTNRPVLSQLRKDVKSGKITAVVVTRLDRITRSIVDLWQLIREFREYQVEFISLAERIETEGPAGRFLANILGSLAQFEREIIASRVTESMHSRALQGKWNGGPIPYGYTTQGRVHNEAVRENRSKDQALKLAAKRCPEEKVLYPDAKEAKVVCLLFELYLEIRSIRETARLLNQRGYHTRNGGYWTATTVARVLTSPVYIGKVCYGKRKTNIDTGKITRAEKGQWKTAEGLHEGIISAEMFDTVQEILAETSQKPKKRSRTYLLAGLLRCGKCGRTMYGYTYNKPDGRVYSYYKCSKTRPFQGAVNCAGLAIPAERLEEFIADTLKGLSQDTVFLSDKQRMLRVLREETAGKTDYTVQERRQLRKEESDLEERREALLEHLERRVIDESLFRERYDKIMEGLEENRASQEKLAVSQASSQSLKECLEASFEEIASFEKNWDVLDAEGRQSLLQTVIKEVTVTKEDVHLTLYLDTSGLVDAAPRMGVPVAI